MDEGPILYVDGRRGNQGERGVRDDVELPERLGHLPGQDLRRLSTSSPMRRRHE